MQSRRTLKWILHGRVQRVGFRWFARRAARELSVTGWVRNRVDGSVELEATGTETALAAFKEHLRLGPPGAVVSSIDEDTVDRASDAGDFEIIR